MKILNLLSYLWVIVVNTVIVFIVLAMFNSVYGNFETIILSISVLIYLQIISFFSLWSCSILEEKYNKEKENEEFKGKIEKFKTKFWIQQCFTFIVYLIALLNLLGAL